MSDAEIFNLRIKKIDNLLEGSQKQDILYDV